MSWSGYRLMGQLDYCVATLVDGMGIPSMRFFSFHCSFFQLRNATSNLTMHTFTHVCCLPNVKLSECSSEQDGAAWRRFEPRARVSGLCRLLEEGQNTSQRSSGSMAPRRRELLGKWSGTGGAGWHAHHSLFLPPFQHFQAPDGTTMIQGRTQKHLSLLLILLVSLHLTRGQRPSVGEPVLTNYCKIGKFNS